MNLKQFFFKEPLFIRILMVLIPMLVLIGCIFIAFSSFTPMIGDETAHYYELLKQCKHLPNASFGWSVSTAYGKTRIALTGTHVIGWQYLGALFYYLLPYFYTVQFYHLIYFCLLILFSYLTVKHLYNSDEVSCNALLLICTLPVCLLFGIAFYQDLPLTTLYVICFYLLFRKKYFLAIIISCLAYLMKENALLILPGLTFLLVLQEHKKPLKCFAWIIFSYIAFFSCVMLFDLIVYIHSGYTYHSMMGEALMGYIVKLRTIGQPIPQNPVVCSYPGDLRVPINWFIYFGGVVWLAVIASFFGLFRKIRYIMTEKKSLICLALGLSYLVPTYIIGKNNPDVRYFLPGVPFLIFAVSSWLRHVKFYRLILLILLFAATIQTVGVFHKIYTLRTLGPDLEQVINVLNKEKTVYSNKKYKIFMYAEKWRFLPYEPMWSYYDEVWQAKTPEKIYKVLRKHDYAFVGIVKSKIASIGDNPDINIRLYPRWFVRCLEKSDLFKKKCENNTYIVYELKPNH